mgnify:CR=1 FL=1
MKTLTIAALLTLAACAPSMASGLEISASAGASIPSGDSHTGVSPSVQASVIKTIGKYLGFGVRVGQDMNFVQKDKPQADGSRGNGIVPGNPYASGIHQHQGQDQDQEQSQEQNSNQDNDQTVTVNILPPVIGVPPKTLRNLAPSSIFSIEPVIRAGYPLGNWLPYAISSFGVSRVDRQDGVKDWGNAYSWGGGVRYNFDDYFAGVEGQRQQVCTSVSTYNDDKYFFSFGWGF